MSLLLAVNIASSPVNYTLTCAAGNYTFTGKTAILQVQHSLVCNAGSYTYTGNAATLQVNHYLSCASGAYAYTGIAATLTYVPGASAVNYTLTCSAGSYTYTGIVASLIYVQGTSVQTSTGGGGREEPTEREISDFLEFLRRKRKKKKVEVIEEIVEELEESVFSDEVRQIIQETAVTTERQKPVRNYQAILNDIEALKQIVLLYQQYLEEEELIVFLLAA